MSWDKPEFTGHKTDGMRFAIVASRYNQELVDSLLDDALKTLREAGIKPSDSEVHRVPGSNELPYAVNMLVETADFDCIIALGVIIQGETPHFDIISRSTAQSLQDINASDNTPIINGIIVAHNKEQAEVRCRGEKARGREFALAAIEMAKFKMDMDERLGTQFEQMANALDEEDADWLDDREDDEDRWKS